MLHCFWVDTLSNPVLLLMGGGASPSRHWGVCHVIRGVRWGVRGWTMTCGSRSNWLLSAYRRTSMSVEVTDDADDRNKNNRNVSRWWYQVMILAGLVWWLTPRVNVECLLNPDPCPWSFALLYTCIISCVLFVCLFQVISIRSEVWAEELLFGLLMSPQPVWVPGSNRIGPR